MFITIFITIFMVIAALVLIAQGLALILDRKSNTIADAEISDNDLFMIDLLLYAHAQSIVYYEIAHEAIDAIDDEVVKNKMRERMKNTDEETRKILGESS